MRRAAIAYVALAVVLTGIVAFAVSRHGATPTLAFPGRNVIGGWCRFDCTWYVDIADRGYTYVPGHQSSVAFFPGYPLVVRAFDAIIGNPIVSSALVTWLAGLSAVVLFARWSLDRLASRLAVGAVAAFLLYPYGWFLFGAGYADALFLAFVIGAFLLLERDRPLLAGLAAAAGGATRPTGIGLVLGLGLVALDRSGGLPKRTDTGWWARLGIPARVELRRFRRRDAWVLVAFAGPIAWSVWLADRFGDGFLFVTVQKAWHQTQGFHTWFKIGFGGQVLRGADTGYTVGLVIQALLTLAALLAVPAVIRRFGAGYGGYTLVIVVLAALGTKDFQGMGRYVLAAFPLFALAGARVVESRRLVVPVMVGSGVLLAIGAFGFGRGWYLT